MKPLLIYEDYCSCSFWWDCTKAPAYSKWTELQNTLKLAGLKWSSSSRGRQLSKYKDQVGISEFVHGTFQFRVCYAQGVRIRIRIRIRIRWWWWQAPKNKETKKFMMYIMFFLSSHFNATNYVVPLHSACINWSSTISGLDWTGLDWNGGLGWKTSTMTRQQEFLPVYYHVSLICTQRNSPCSS